MIETILNNAIKHSRELLKAKAGNKYYFDDNLLKEKGKYKEFLYGDKMNDHKYNEFNKVRNFVGTLREFNESIIEKDSTIKNKIYKNLYENIMHERGINEQNIKKRNEIRSAFREQEEYRRLYKIHKAEREATIYKELYNYTLSNKENLLTGNCPDYCNCAFHYLINNYLDDILRFFNTGSATPNHIYIQIIGTLGMYDHVFITIGAFNHNMFKPILGRLYHNLPKELWICDPWANIVCPAEKYNEQWINKMDKWHYIGKCLTLAETPTPNGQVIPPSANCQSPIKKSTYLTIQNSVKKVFNLAIISPDKNVIITAL
ncbi:hypothetical protein [Xenorhabdus sp. BG5]|uniref:hypothetical protein n=1 Tax=Xenorhabdus sp. BG5 TaxID=2782014 RepID=UPI00187E16C5|nr:hypothetical protein [Xenorhabdus sp. BG5]MBE8596748.1 hypothetical protein [Xenorhabdus sp. BG5]